MTTLLISTEACKYTTNNHFSLSLSNHLEEGISQPKTTMADLHVYRLTPTKYQTISTTDPGHILFTTIYEPHILHDVITRLYRGPEEAGDVTAMFRGLNEVVSGGVVRRAEEMVFSEHKLGM
jgi:hypothetical protein